MTSPRPTAFGDYQLEIYLAGLHGTLPRLPMAYPELEARAAQALPPSVLSYVAGGAGRSTPSGPTSAPSAGGA